MIQRLYDFISTPEHPVNITKFTQNTGNDSNDILPEGVVWCEENSPYIGENACVTVRHRPSKKQKIAKSLEIIKPAENLKPTEMVKIQFNKKGIVETKSYPCKLCSERFFVNETLTEHIIRQHHFCEFCKDFFETFEELKNHVGNVHEGQNNRPCICETCGKGFDFLIELGMISHKNHK